MLYLAIPAQNEVATIGVLLWRLRTVLAEFPREYEVVVYDDASSDETALVAEQYVHAMPVTVLRGTTPVGYAGAVDALIRYIAGQTRYPRRDAMMLLQGDFTDPPGIVPEFARRFEGGADLVVGERSAVADAPVSVKRLFSAAGWALKPFVRVDGIRDLTGSMRLMRISTLRDALRVAGDAPVCEGDSWTANADLLLRLVPHARKVESVPVEPTYGVRTRETRRVTVRDGLAALRWGWRARGRKATPTTAPESAADGATRSSRSPTAPRRRDEGELTAEHLRERSRDRDRLRGDSETVSTGRDGRTERGRRDGKREDKREDKRERTREPKRDEARTEARPEPRAERKREDGRGEKRDKREKRREPARESASAATAELDELAMTDPFAGRSSSRTTEGTPARVEQKPLEADAAVSPIDGATPVAPDADRARPSATASAAAAGEDLTADLDDENDADDGAETAEDEAGAGTDARERKRRRNRRSRRRRSKNRGAGEGDASTDVVGASVESTDIGGTREADHANDRADDDGGDDAETEGDDSSDAGSAEDGADAAARSRSRRRGRRGRRGGSRRGRGRGNRGGEGGDAESGGSDTGGGPPAGDPPPAE